MKKIIKILALSAVIFFNLIVASIILIPLIIDPNDYKDDIAIFVKEKTGRELVFEGDIELFIYPCLGFELVRVRLGNAPGFGKEAFASVESAKVKIKVLPFLKKRLEVDSFSLRGLEINLKRAKSGRTNWENLLGATAAEKKEGEKKVGWTKQTPHIPAISFSSIRISDARLVWDDQQKGNYAIISGLDLHTSRVVLDEPFHLNLAFNLHNRRPQVKGHAELSVKMTLDTEAQSVLMEKITLDMQLRGKSLPSGKASASLVADVSLELSKHALKVANLNLDALGMSIKGNLKVSSLFDKPAFKGKLNISRFSLRKFLIAMGKTPPKTADPKALSKASVDLVFDASARSLNMKKLVLRLDDATIKGHVSIKNFAKPEIAFDLRADKIDVDRYLPPKSKGRAKLKKKALPPRKAAHKGKRGLSLEPLRALELDGRLRIGKVKVYNLKMKDILLTITAHKGIIRLHPLQASLYSGKYSGDMIFDVHGKVAKISTKENVKGVQVGPLLRDLIGEEKLSGTADVSVSITTKGNTDMALRKALSGKVSFSVADGCLRGYVVPGTGSNRWSDPEDEDSKPAKKITSTDFSEARGTVWIRNGVARNHDFKFYSPSVKATGKGHADLFAEQLDYLLYVKIPSMPTFPIRIHGPFSNPRSDLQVGKMVKGTLIGIVKGLEDTAKKGKEAIQNIGKGVRDIFKGIFQ